jgi:prepilin-type N-terminal cleavage/methylation domain-containing protein
MQSFKKKGFALIEIMVVLTLLSIAAAISIPFYVKQMRTERQQQCPKMLQSFVKAEQSYYDEHGVFSPDLRELQWHPTGKTVHLYGFRWAPLFRASTSLIPDNLCTTGLPDCYTTDHMKRVDGTQLQVDDLPNSAKFGEQYYVFGCVGNLDSDSALDRFTIDQTGQLIHVTNDLD